jgi:hypothetical protein
VKTLDYLFVVLVTLVTVASVKVIGAILVGALLVIPAAAARLVSQSLKGFFFVSVLIATVSTLLGILLPIVLDLPVPSGAAIILVAGICFALAAWPAPSSPACKETRHEPETPPWVAWPACRRSSCHASADHPAGDPQPGQRPARRHRGAAHAAPANLPASRQPSYFSRGGASLAKAAQQADAVIGVRSIWRDDPLYPMARRSNIRIVEIDAARPVDGACRASR